jgi:hypothetical protein
VSTDGSYLFVAWNSIADVPCQISCPPSLALDVARVTTDGVVALATHIVDHSGGTAAVLWTGSQYAVFWGSVDPETSVPNGLAAMRFDRRGRPIETQPVKIDSKPRADGPRLLWNDLEFIEAVETAPLFQAPSEFLVNRIDRALRLTETMAIPTEGRRSAVPARFGDRDFILYSKTILESPYHGVPRIVIRSIDPLPRSRAVRR